MAPLLKVNNIPEEERSVSLNCTENQEAKKPLDIIVFILADEYIEIAKENPGFFLT
jgi:hypothetical protein